MLTWGVCCNLLMSYFLQESNTPKLPCHFQVKWLFPWKHCLFRTRVLREHMSQGAKYSAEMWDVDLCMIWTKHIQDLNVGSFVPTKYIDHLAINHFQEIFSVFKTTVFWLDHCCLVVPLFSLLDFYLPFMPNVGWVLHMNNKHAGSFCVLLV